MVEIRRLTPDDAELYRTVRLEGLERHPEAFGASFETERAAPLSFFSQRLAESCVFGAFMGTDLQGVEGHFASTSLKERHKAVLFGMYVRPAGRGTGIGQALVDAVVSDAKEQYDSIQLTVLTSNGSARRLYERCGFETYGVEPRSLLVDGVYYDEALMYRRLDGGKR